MKINNIEFPDLLIKIGKEEHLKDIVKGHINFNNVEFYRNNGHEKANDISEGKIKINPASLKDAFPDLIKYIDLKNPPEMRFSDNSIRDIPLFCCSVLDDSILVQTLDNHYDLSFEFLNEMKDWGSTILVMSTFELVEKIDLKCEELGINALTHKVAYPKTRKIYDYNEVVDYINTSYFDPLFIKDYKYKNQNEFRIALYNSTNKLRSGHFLDIGKLEHAFIFNLEQLADLGIRILNQDMENRRDYE